MISRSQTCLVIDIGKTNLKIHALDESDNHLISFNRKNITCKKNSYHSVDVDDIWSWILKTIKI